MVARLLRLAAFSALTQHFNNKPVQRVTRYAVSILLVAGLAVLAVLAQPSISLVKTIDETSWGNYKIEDITVCSNGEEAWVTAIGPGAQDALRMFKITGIDTATPRVDKTSFIDFVSDGHGGMPDGMGPRGFPGVDIDISCAFAVIPNFLLDSVMLVDLRRGSQVGNVKVNDGTIIWPRGFPKETGVKIKSPMDAKIVGKKVLVTGSDGLYVLNTDDGALVEKVVPSQGIGPGGLVAQVSMAAFVTNSRAVECVIFEKEISTTTIAGLGAAPYMIVPGPSLAFGPWYVSNQGSNNVSVLKGLMCDKKVEKSIDVGRAPRHMSVSPDGLFLFVSNSVDNTVSVIDTQSLSVVETLEATEKGEPAAIGVNAISGNNRYLSVFCGGCQKGESGKFQIRVFDVSSLY